MPLACPACRSEMQPTEFMGLNLDVCPQCAGIWFDDNELTALSNEAPSSLLTLDEKFLPEIFVHGGAEKMKKCPRDDTRLDTYRYAYDTPIHIDSCPRCHGVFVEDRELAGIGEAIQHKDRVKFTATMKARRELSGAPTEEANVSALIHALHHWRETAKV